jgi:hypothetical protein
MSGNKGITIPISADITQLDIGIAKAKELKQHLEEIAKLSIKTKRDTVKELAWTALENQLKSSTPNANVIIALKELMAQFPY